MKPTQRNFRENGAIRRSQMVTLAGPGAVIDLVDHAVIIKGLDHWSYHGDEADSFIDEPRLAHKALARLRANGGWSHGRVRLRLPPRCEDIAGDKGPWRGVHARRFPTWTVCRRCRALVRVTDSAQSHVCYEGARGSKKDAGKLVPVRFVAGCPRGHLQDINWRGFVHRGQREPGVDKPYYCAVDHERGELIRQDGDTHTADLALIVRGSSGELSDQLVLCRRCGRSRSLQDLRAPKALGPCQGWRAWLTHDDDGCDEELKLLIRTGSNVWFPVRDSVLHIPETRDAIDVAVEARWDVLQNVESEAALRTLWTLIPAIQAAFTEPALPEVLTAIQRRRAGSGDPRSIREVEWDELMKADWGNAHDLPPTGSTWYPVRLQLPADTHFERVVLVHSLREVRALLGFTRFDGITVGPEGDAEGHQAFSPLGEDTDWIPAVEVFGEGVFLALDEHKLRAWEALDAVKARAEQFAAASRRANEAGDAPARRSMEPRLILLHSLAHMLITQISLECGYSASAIRERIYCYRDPEDPARSRAGILLYTGTPGSEGTLGGLVEVGADIFRHLRAALDRQGICSNDPVCAQHRPDGPEDGRDREGAACHACLLIAEPSCERMNRDLDRALVLDTVETVGAGFLGDWGGGLVGG